MFFLFLIPKSVIYGKQRFYDLQNGLMIEKSLFYWRKFSPFFQKKHPTFQCLFFYHHQKIGFLYQKRLFHTKNEKSRPKTCRTYGLFYIFFILVLIGIKCRFHRKSSPFFNDCMSFLMSKRGLNRAFLSIFYPKKRIGFHRKSSPFTANFLPFSPQIFSLFTANLLPF